MKPALSTIDYPAIDMGKVTARIRVKDLKGVAYIQNINMIIIRSNLIVRKSSLKKFKN